MESRFVGRIILFLIWLKGWAYYCAYRISPSRFPRLIGGGLGLLLRLFRVRSRVIHQNLLIAFPGDEALATRKKLYHAAYQHLGELICELFMLLGPMKYFIRQNVEVRGFENLKKAHEHEKGVFILTSHVGNWEIEAGVGPDVLGLNLLMVTKKLKPSWLHEAILNARGRMGVQGTYEPRTMRDVLAHLKKNGTVGFVLDQYSGPPVAVRVPFFGVPVGTGVALATLVKRTGASVVPVVNYRKKEGGFVVEIFPELLWKDHPNPKVELAVNTAQYVAALESHVRAHADQWLWTHQRFKGDLSPLKEGEWEGGR